MLYERGASRQPSQSPEPNKPSITGADTRTQRTIQEALTDPLLQDALQSIFPSPITDLRLAPTQTRLSSLRMRKKLLVFEYNRNKDGVLALRQEVFGQAALEEALKAVASFIPNTLPNREALGKTLVFLALCLDRPITSESDVRNGLGQLVRLHRAALEKRSKKLLKNFERIPQLEFTSVDDTRFRLHHFGHLMHDIQAISLAIDTPRQRADTVEKLESAVLELHIAIFAVWQKALFEGNAGLTSDAINLFKTLRETVASPGFNYPEPPFFPTNTKKGQTFRLFAPPILAHLSGVISAAGATARLDQTLRAWTPPNSEPLRFLRSRLFNVVTGLPANLNQFHRAPPADLPHEISECIETLCLLRLHGERAGLALFALFACDLSPVERKQASSNPEATLAAHSEDYTELLGLLATWPLKTSASERQDLTESIHRRLRFILRNVLLNKATLLEEFLTSSLASLETGVTLDGARRREVRCFLRELARDVIDLGNETLSRYAILTTASLRSIVALHGIHDVQGRSPSSARILIDRMLKQQRHQLELCGDYFDSDTQRFKSLYRLTLDTIVAAESLRDKIPS